MADADLDAVIRQLAKAQSKTLMAAAKKRRDGWLARAGKAVNKDAKAQFKSLARETMLQGQATARRLQNAAENAADSYARAMKKAAEQPPAKKPAKKKEA